MSHPTLPQLPSPAKFDIYEKSQETMEALRANIKVGFTDERGPAWWANGAVTKAGDWTTIPDGSHFPQGVPMAEVEKLLDVRLVKAESVSAAYLDEDGNLQIATDPGTLPIINQRTGQIFGYPKEGYRIHPYLQTLRGFMQQIQYDEDVAVGSVGLLRKGGVAFLQAVLSENFEVAGYGFQPYLTGVTSADLSRKTTFATGAKGAVCDNTVNTAFAEAVTKFGYKHTRNSQPRVQQARERLGIQLVQAGEDIGQAIDQLTNIPVSDAEWDEWLNLTTPIPEKKAGSRTGGAAYTNAITARDRLEELWNYDPKGKPWKNTAFGVLQVDNTDRTWNQLVRKTNRIERNFANDVFGVTEKADAKALDALVQVKGTKTLIAV